MPRCILRPKAVLPDDACSYCRALYTLEVRRRVRRATGLYCVVRIWANAPDFGPKPMALCGVCAKDWNRSAEHTGLTVVLLVPPITPAAVDAALASLATATLPSEPRGADLTWRAIERERGYDELRRWFPDDGDSWKGKL
jgi:hypothetical protein